MALFGIYGEHTPENCPLNNVDAARQAHRFAIDNAGVDPKAYGIGEIVGQYHSALEHTFLWIVEAESAHELQRFCMDAGLASFNTLRIVPLTTFGDGVVPNARRIHGL